MSNTLLRSTVHSPSTLRGPFSPAFYRSDMLSAETSQAYKWLVQERSSLSSPEKSHLESSAFTFGQAPETYDVVCTQGTVMRTPCGNGMLNLHRDGRFWHFPGGIIAHPDLKPQMVQWLKKFSEQQRQTVLVYSVCDHELDEYRRAGYAINKFGEEPVIDLTSLSWKGSAYEWVRRQTNYCIRAGLEVIEVSDSQTQLELASQLDEIHDDDLSDRVYSKPLKLLEGEFNSRSLHRRRLFVARNRETHRIEGFLSTSPMINGKSWAFETYRKRHTAPRGTIPFLFRAVMDIMQGEGVEQASLCVVPGRGVQSDQTIHTDKRIRWLLETWYKRLNFMFNTAGQDFFKSRFRPQYQNRSICVYPQNTLGSFSSFLKTAGALRPNLRNLVRHLVRGGKHSAHHD
jgi:phosphatidylglycerol lysyltransferase